MAASNRGIIEVFYQDLPEVLWKTAKSLRTVGVTYEFNPLLPAYIQLGASVFLMFVYLRAGRHTYNVL
jgi:hypothetical protein